MPRRPVMTIDELNKWFIEQKRVTDNGCWEWTGCICGGYGRFTIKGKRILTHRYSLQLYLKREIPKELEVRHMCNNSICFNPEHLQEGTHYQNMQDMVNSNRQAKGDILSSKLKGVKHPKVNGELNPKSKLTKEDVIFILSLKGQRGCIKKLSEMYNVSCKQISRIQNGKSWSHITN